MAVEKNYNQTVFVGVSGGVDSSVSAALLLEAGYDVVGVFIRTWQPEWIECTWRDERRDAMKVCATLDIPFLECDLTEEYKKGVADYMIEEYRRGRTPNPDVMCNKVVKFGAFYTWARDKGADYIATGHYARIRINRNGPELLRGIDEGKDQSYFLWTITQEQLTHTLFPLGDKTKDEVRNEAEQFGLPTARKKDSQGICFLGQIDMKEFLSRYISTEEGQVLDTNGNAIGTHPGALLFTLGERHGFTITQKGTDDRPRYVVAKDLEDNTITVSKDPKEYQKTLGKTLQLTDTNWVASSPRTETNYSAQIRYHGEKKNCRMKELNNTRAIVELEEPDATIASGQSLVMYDGEVCLGGGIVH